MDELRISTALDTKGFEAGSKRLGDAIKSFGTGVDKSMRTVQSAGKSILGTIMKWGPALLGIRGVYQMISRATQSFMAENKQLSANLSSAWTALGNVLGPIITTIVNLITTAMSYFIAFLRLLGLTSKSASEASKSAQGAGAALKKQLMGFDELNVLQDSGGGGGANGSLEDKELPEWLEMFGEFIKNGLWHEAADVLVAEMNRLTDIARSKAAEFGEKIGYYLNGALTIIADVIKKFNWQQIGEVLALGLNSMIAQVDWENLGTILIGKFWIMFNALVGFLDTFDWKEGTKALFDVIQAMIFSVDWIQLIADLVDGFIKLFNGVTDGMNDIPWDQIGQKISDMIKDFFLKPKWLELAISISKFLAGALQSAATMLNSVDGKGIADAIYNAIHEIWKNRFEFDNLAKSFMTFLGSALKLAIDFGSELVEAIWADIKKAWADYTLDENGQFSLQKLKDSLVQSWSDVSNWIYTNIVKPFFDGLGIRFEIGARNMTPTEWITALKDKILGKVSAIFGENSAIAEAFNTIIETVQSVWDAIVSFINGTLGTSSGDSVTDSGTGPQKLIRDVVDIIDSVKEKADGLSETWSKIKEFLTSKVFGTGPKSLLDGVYNTIQSINTMKKNILSSVWSDIIEPFLTKTDGEKSGLEKTLDGIVSVVGSVAGLATEFGSALTTLWSDFLSPMAGWTVNEALPELMTKISEGINSLPMSSLSGIASNLGTLWTSFLQPLLGQTISEGVPAFFNTLGSVMTILSSTAGIVVPLLSDFWNTFLSPLLSVSFSAVTDLFDGIADFFVLLEQLLNGKIGAKDFVAGVAGIFIDTSYYVNASNEELTRTGEILGAIYEQGENIKNEFAEGGEQFGGYISFAKDQFAQLGEEITTTVGATEAASSANEEYKQKLENIITAYEDSVNSAKNYDSVVRATGKMKAELTLATLNYAKALNDQGIAIDDLIPLLVQQGLSLEEIATHLGTSAEQVTSMVDKEVELAGATSDAAESGKELVESTNQTPEAMENAETSMASYGEQTSTTADDVQAATEKESEAIEKMAEDNKTSFDTVILNASDLGESLTETVENAQTSFQTMDTNVGQSLENMGTNVTDFGDLLTSTIETAMSTAKTSISEYCNSMKSMLRDSLTQAAVLVNAGWQGVVNVTSNAINAITNLVDQGHIVIANAAFYWGADLVLNMVAGILAQWAAIEGVIGQLAAMVASYLGFSEPEKGPLSNFHTFMPDMMQLMADGIKDNMDLPMNAVEDLADGISDEIQSGDYALGDVASGEIDIAMDHFADRIVDGFTNLISRLEDIAANVTFGMPAVAMGGVVPYSIGAGIAQNGSERQATADDIVQAIYGLQALLSNSNGNEAALNVNVYLDGQQITDVVTKRQRQTGRSWGTL